MDGVFRGISHPTLTPHQYHRPPRVTLATSQITNQTITNSHTPQEPLSMWAISTQSPLNSRPLDSKWSNLPASAVSALLTTPGDFPEHKTIQGYSTRWRSGSVQRTPVKREPVLSRIEYVQSKRYAMQAKEKKRKEKSEYSVSHVINAEWRRLRISVSSRWDVSMAKRHCRGRVRSGGSQVCGSSPLNYW